MCCNVLQFVAVWLCVAVCCSVLQCGSVCCSVLQCVAVWCSVLQCVAASVQVSVPVYVATVAQMNVTLHISGSHVTQINESYNTHECVKSHAWMYHWTRMCDMTHWDMTHWDMTHWDMTHSWMYHSTQTNRIGHVSLSFSAYVMWCRSSHGVATISRLLKIIGLFCKRAL